MLMINHYLPFFIMSCDYSITKGSKISSANHRLLLFTRFFHRNVRLVESHIKVKIFMQNFSFGMFLIKCYWFLPCPFFFFLLGCFSSVGYILNNHLLLILLYNLLPSPSPSPSLPLPSTLLPPPSSLLPPPSPSAQTSEQAPHRWPEPESADAEGGYEAEGDRHEQEHEAEPVDLPQLPLEVRGYGVGHGGYVDPQRSVGDVQQRDGEEHGPAAWVGHVLGSLLLPRATALSRTFRGLAGDDHGSDGGCGYFVRHFGCFWSCFILVLWVL